MCSIENRKISAPASATGTWFKPSGNAEGRDLVVHHRHREERAVVGHQRAEDADQHVDDDLELQAQALGHQHEQRLHADMAGVAHADRRAEHRHPDHEHQRERLRPGGRVVHDVAAEHLEGHAGDDGHQARHRHHQKVLGQRRTDTREEHEYPGGHGRE